jgi:hypothetical protein
MRLLVESRACVACQRVACDLVVLFAYPQRLCTPSNLCRLLKVRMCCLIFNLTYEKLGVAYVRPAYRFACDYSTHTNQGVLLQTFAE